MSFLGFFKEKTIIVLLLLLLCIFFFWRTETSDKVTPTDRVYIKKILAFSHFSPPTRSASEMTYQEQLQFIQEAQYAVLAIAPDGTPEIPFYHEREPKDLYLRRQGFCFDRSRTIQKILTAYGFETLHLAIYSTAQAHSKLKSLLTAGVESHAVSDIKTKRG